MRTTLDIADDVLRAAKEIARRERKSAGQVLSDLARAGLSRPAARRGRRSDARGEGVLGFEPFPSRGGIVTDDLVSALREADPDE